ncbi:DNA-directed RNA polymerase III subunit RPC25 [Guillardia theta CCMP2712]|uniref:DNA-directed RNA polymerase III subunit RPC25 n=1 Tax=Guillardia theta (strain CCMP2712) TaxID=905079 RepID=L1JI02_GUITC|nr:DNA-directed RNA polymerase III subunit RPC25 [Guillardia theta CCMP2712]EKX47764.1 DNA-directed RNA polymerase III subunit RPC25 [Guillardia theta CCMP2712]|eukprot:XP_005834744.1 DNA-directed RNA polymerase III subunit RPC25 [Guillardia theta CCMP2712]
MFVLVKMKDAVPIPASELSKPRSLAVSNQIEKKYSNRVLLGTGLCVCLYEIEELGEGLIYPSDSAVHVRVTFSLVVFRPFIGEVITGSIHRSTPEGLWISLGFFQDIFVPPHFMQDGSEWDEEHQLWVWKSEHGDAMLDPAFGSPRFVDRKNTPARTGQEQEQEDEPAFQVMASIKDDGLGLAIWWE